MDSSDDDETTNSNGARVRRRRVRQLPTQSSNGDGDRSDEDEQRYHHRQQPTLTCATESVKLLVTLLNCLVAGGGGNGGARRTQRVRCDADCHGLLFTVHSRGKALQIKTSLARELFDSYTLVATDVTATTDNADELQLSFALDLQTLVECLSVFGAGALATTSLRLSYAPQSARLALVLEDSGVITECALQVLEHDANDVGLLEFEGAFESAAVVGRCIMQSTPLHDAFAELYDLPSAASVTIALYGRSQKGLSLRATSESGSCEIAFGARSSAFLEFFCAAQGDGGDGGDGAGDECAATFHVAVLQQAFKALAHSNETFLRMNADGFLSVQHMVESGTGEKAFVDALISPEDASVQ